MKILERFGITVPRPRGKPRGTLRARRGSHFGPPAGKFSKPTAGSENIVSDDFAMCVAWRNLKPTFFNTRFFKGGLAGLGRAGCHQTPAEMDPKFLKLLRGHLGWGHAAHQVNQTSN